MIFYHFTSITRFLVPGTMQCEIPDEGLLPHSERADFVSCVWLTTEADPGARYPDKNCLRVTVSIRKADKNLISYRKWLQRLPKRDLSNIPHVRRSMRTWYMYFGTIPQDWTTDLDLLQGQFPWWLIQKSSDPS
jgi:hypothetical protein